MPNQKIEVEGLELLDRAFQDEPEKIKAILKDRVVSALNTYSRNLGEEVRDEGADVDDLVRCDIVLPSLALAGSYKKDYFRYYPIDVKIATHYGKEWNIYLKVCSFESTREQFFMVDEQGRQIVVHYWSSPLYIKIIDVAERKSPTWLTADEVDEYFDEELKKYGEVR